MSAGFLSKLEFEDDGGLPFTLLQPLIYESEVLGWNTVTVPSGFRTDLASIPRPLWAVLPPVGKYDAAAVIHDYLYVTGGVTRHQADNVLNEAMTMLHVGDGARRAIYLGVILGGWVQWRKYRAA